MESRTQLKQIKFSALNDIVDLKEEVREVNNRLYPEGSFVDVKRGNGVWRVKVLGFDSISDPELFRGLSANGNIHWFHADFIDEG